MSKFSSKWLQDSPETPRYEGCKSLKSPSATFETPIVPRSSGETEPSQQTNDVNVLPSTVGDGQPPPLHRPPKTEQELRRLIDYLVDPENFTRWLAWAMNRVDPAEMEGDA